jgi:hypothetical protein
VVWRSGRTQYPQGLEPCRVLLPVLTGRVLLAAALRGAPNRSKFAHRASKPIWSNPVELVWWSLHEAVSRNHECSDLDDLMEFAEGYLKERQPFMLKLGEIYD